jgi:AP-4 complex subunit mu-1
VNFIHLKRQNMYFVCTTRYNVSASLILEYIERLCVVLRDFIGVESEESYRKNFLLIYEILDEIAVNSIFKFKTKDYGYIQNTMGLKYFVINEPIEDLTYDSIFNLPVNTVINNVCFFKIKNIYS